MRSIFNLSGLVLISSLSAYAVAAPLSIGDSVTATVPAITKASVGHPNAIVITIKTVPPVHIQGNPTLAYNIATTVKMQAVKGLKIGKIVYPKPKVEEVFGTKTPIYEGTIKITAYETAFKPGKYTVPIQVTYQACNAQNCMPPETVDLKAKLEVSKAKLNRVKTSKVKKHAA